MPATIVSGSKVSIIAPADSGGAGPLYPSLYEMNTRVHLTGLSGQLSRRATLDDIADADLDGLADLGFDWLWLLSVWEIGSAGREVSRSHRDWRREFEETLPDLREEDIAGSGFAVASYKVQAGLGGKAALARLRERLRRRGIRLMLDFVPNHTAIDHPWVQEHPEYYVAGTERDYAQAPQNYLRLGEAGHDRFLAHGRDPNFSGWPDTLQLNYGNPDVQRAMIGELEAIAAQCDGVRCDMAMLLLPDIFARTWGIGAEPFWRGAIERVRAQRPDFVFMAEAYWDLEWTMMQEGFDYAYDKRLYDRLRGGEARAVREHLLAGLDYQNRLARFLENHDEARAAAVFPPGMHESVAVITYLSPGLRFFHQGQSEGRTKRISPHLIRAPTEPADGLLQQFYGDLLARLRRPSVFDGEWRLLECGPAWDGNWTHDCFVAWCWASGGERTLVAVNYAAHQSQCFVRLPWPDLAGRAVRLNDVLSAAAYTRDGDMLVSQGLYLDLPPWGRHAFAVSAVA